jgi:hypothetical protein
MPNSSAELSHALRSLIAETSPQLHLRELADDESTRLIVRLGLRHPMTLSAALKVVASEMPHGRFDEIEPVARALRAKLSKWFGA